MNLKKPMCKIEINCPRCFLFKKEGRSYMKKNLAVILLTSMLLLLFAGCGNQVKASNLSKNEGSTKDAAQKVLENSVAIVDKSADLSIETVALNMADEVNGNVHLGWRNVGLDDCDGIELCRADVQGGELGELDVIATITQESNGFYNDGYIDFGAAGKGYFYGVRLIKGNSHGKLSNIIEARKSGQSWYKNESSYLCALLENGGYVAFREFDLTGNTIWNCDWPYEANPEPIRWYVIENENEVEYSRSFQYRLITPNEYSEAGAPDFTFYVNFDAASFTYTMYQYDCENHLPIFNDTSFNSL